jgi:hypothetical protein
MGEMSRIFQVSKIINGRHQRVMIINLDIIFPQRSSTIKENPFEISQLSFYVVEQSQLKIKSVLNDFVEVWIKCRTLKAQKMFTIKILMLSTCK